MNFIDMQLTSTHAVTQFIKTRYINHQFSEFAVDTFIINIHAHWLP